jgi:cytochrome d ubiquinol oxidase subunit II
VDAPRWRRAWDLAFGWGSLGTALLLGVAFGNVLGGIPLDAAGEYHGSFVGLLDPFSVLVGLAGSALFVMQGAAYLATKTDGELRERMRVWRGRGWAAFVVLFAAVVVAALFAARHLFEGALQDPLAWAFFLLLLAALLAVPLASRGRRDAGALLASSLAIGSVMGLAAANLFPRLAPSSLDLAASLTAYGQSSTPYALRIMLAIALLGMPLVLAYTIWIHRIFRGKVVLDEHSY